MDEPIKNKMRLAVRVPEDLPYANHVHSIDSTFAAVVDRVADHEGKSHVEVMHESLGKELQVPTSALGSGDYGWDRLAYDCEVEARVVRPDE